MSATMTQLGFWGRMQARAAGYHWATAQRFSLNELEPLLKQGSAVLWAAAVTGTTWALAGYNLTQSAGMATRLAAAAAGFAAGSSLVFTFDSGFLYAADTTYKPSRSRLAGYAAVRVAMIVGIASITAQYTIPLVLGGDLEVQKQALVQGNELQLRESLRQSRGLDALRSQAEDDNRLVQQLRQEAAVLPAEVQAQWTAARACQRQASAQQAALKANPSATEGDRAQVRTLAERCSQLGMTARRAQMAHQQAVNARLVQAEQAQQRNRDSLQASTQELETDVKESRQTDQRALGVHSQKVLWSLLTSNPAALAKWLAFSAVLLLCELMPLLLKAQIGQSVPGRRIAAERRVAEGEADADASGAERGAHRAHADLDLDMAILQDALADPDVREERKQLQVARIKAQAIMDHRYESMRELVEVEQRMQALLAKQQTRQPELRQVMERGWQDALGVLKI